MRKLTIFLLFITLLAMVSASVAQNAVEIEIFVEPDSLTVYVPGNQPVSLQGIGFETVVNGQRQTFYLFEYNAFATFRPEFVPTPICFRLERAGSARVLPQQCPPAQTVFQPLAAPDVWWFDAVTGNSQTFTVVQGVTPVAFCPAGQVRCRITYTLPTPTPAPAATFTPIPTNTPAPTDTPVPTATMANPSVA
ncbi:MAG: hypothetical protein AAF653_00070, partial [Chloroflexota bacterium]